MDANKHSKRGNNSHCNAAEHKNEVMMVCWRWCITRAYGYLTVVRCVSQGPLHDVLVGDKFIW